MFEIFGSQQLSQSARRTQPDGDSSAAANGNYLRLAASLVGELQSLFQTKQIYRQLEQLDRANGADGVSERSELDVADQKFYTETISELQREILELKRSAATTPQIHDAPADDPARQGTAEMLKEAQQKIAIMEGRLREETTASPHTMEGRLREETTATPHTIEKQALSEQIEKMSAMVFELQASVSSLEQERNAAIAKLNGVMQDSLPQAIDSYVERIQRIGERVQSNSDQLDTLGEAMQRQRSEQAAGYEANLAEKQAIIDDLQRQCALQAQELAHMQGGAASESGEQETRRLHEERDESVSKLVRLEMHVTNVGAPLGLVAEEGNFAAVLDKVGNILKERDEFIGRTLAAVNCENNEDALAQICRMREMYLSMNTGKIAEMLGISPNFDGGDLLLAIANMQSSLVAQREECSRLLEAQAATQRAIQDSGFSSVSAILGALTKAQEANKELIAPCEQYGFKSPSDIVESLRAAQDSHGILQNALAPLEAAGFVGVQEVLERCGELESRLDSFADVLQPFTGKDTSVSIDELLAVLPEKAQLFHDLQAERALLAEAGFASSADLVNNLMQAELVRSEVCEKLESVYKRCALALELPEQDVCRETFELLLERVDHLKKSVTDLQERLREARANAATTENQTVEELRRLKEDEVPKLEEKLAVREAEVQQAASNAEATLQRCKELEQSAEASEARARDLTEALSAARDDLAQQRSISSDLQAQVETIMAQLKESEESAAAQIDLLERSESNFADSRAQIDGLEDQLAAAQQSAEEARQALEFAEERCRDAENETATRSEFILQLEALLASGKEEMQEQMRQHESAKSLLSEFKANHEEEIRLEREQKAEVAAKAAELGERIVQLEAQLETAMTERLQALTEYQREFEESRRQADETNGLLQSNLAQKSNEVAELQTAKAKLEAQRDEMILDAESENHKSRQHITQLQDELGVMKTKLAELERLARGGGGGGVQKGSPLATAPVVNAPESAVLPNVPLSGGATMSARRSGDDIVISGQVKRKLLSPKSGLNDARTKAEITSPRKKRETLGSAQSSQAKPQSHGANEVENMALNGMRDVVVEFSGFRDDSKDMYTMDYRDELAENVERLGGR